MKTRLKQSEIDQAVKTVVKSEVFKGMRKYIIFVIIVFPVILLLLSSQVTSKLLPGLAADREADNQSLLITYLPVILVVLFILIGLMYDLLLVKNNRKNSISTAECEGICPMFYKEGLECITDRQVTRVPWERMHKITETEEAVMIFSSESIFWLIPKRFFEGNDFERFVYMVYPMFLNKKIEKLIKKSASRIPKDKKG